MAETVHISVMPEECLEALSLKDGGIYLDCTLGGAGHSKAILERATCQLVAVDRDMRAIERAREKLSSWSEKVSLVHSPFSGIGEALAELDPELRFDGVLADLGISSDQLHEQRGFSFADSGPLDMRMDESAEKTAAQVVNDYEFGRLCRVLKKGGVAPSDVKAVARALERARPIEDTQTLREVVDGVMKGRHPGKKVSPSTVVFQALRIEVNDEFAEIDALLDVIPTVVKPGARVAIMSFHSLEDKLVARRMRKWEQSNSLPALHPGWTEAESKGKLLTRKAITPSDEECQGNRRARSALLRVFEFS